MPKHKKSKGKKASPPAKAPAHVEPTQPPVIEEPVKMKMEPEPVKKEEPVKKQQIMPHRPIEELNKAMQRIERDNELEQKRKELADQRDMELARQEERKMEDVGSPKGQSFGPPLFHRKMRRVADASAQKRVKVGVIGEDGQIREGEEKWEALPRDKAIFKIMSYNLLADSLFDERAEHLDKSDPVRDSKYRDRRVLAEIENSNADIICLQEVNHGDSYFYFISELEQLGYEVIIEKKEEQKVESPGQKAKRPKKFSLLTAFCKKNWSLVDQQHLDFYKTGYCYTNQELYKKQNKGELALLQNTHTKQLLMVANAQLYHGSEQDYVRQAQALFLLEHAAAFEKKHLMKKPIPKKATAAQKKEHESRALPFVMGCDLNSNPDGAAYDVLMGKDIFQEGSVWHKPKETPENMMPQYQAVEACFEKLNAKKKLDPLVNNLESAYLKCTYTHGFHTSRTNTCWSSHRTGMFDHIFFNPSHLKVLQMLEIPLEKSLTPSACGAGEQSQNSVSLLPNVVFPSDHLRLEVQFEITDQ